MTILMSDPNRPLLSVQVKGGLCQVTQQIGNMKRSDTDNNSKATNLKYAKCNNTKLSIQLLCHY